MVHGPVSQETIVVIVNNSSRYFIVLINEVVDQHKHMKETKNLLCHQIRLITLSNRAARKDLKRLFQTGGPKKIQQHTNRHHHFVFRCMRPCSFTPIAPRYTARNTVQFPTNVNQQSQSDGCQGIPDLFHVE